MFAFSDDLQPPNIKLATGNVTDFSENLSAAYDAIQLTGMHDAKQMAITRFLDPFVKETNDLGANINNPGDFYSQLFGRTQERPTGTLKLPAGSIEEGYEQKQTTEFLAFHERLAILNKARAKYNLRELTAEEVFKGAEKLALDAKTKSQYISAHQSTAGWWGEMVGGLGAGAESILTSPAAPMMFIGAPWRMTGSVISQVARHALYDGIAGASLEAMAQPDVKKWWDSLGLKYDSRTFWHHVVVAGGGSAVFGGALRGTIIGVPAAARGLDAAQVKMRGKQFEISREYLRNIDAKELKAFEQAIENLSPDQIREGVRAFQKAGINISPEGQMAFRIMNHDDENPVAGSTVSSQTEHLDRGAQATHALETGLPPNMPERPQNGTIVPDSIHHFDNLDDTIFRYDPNDIEVDAKLFQFKGGGDRFGVIDTLKNVTEWNPDLAGTVHVYEFADGRVFIADGHQRLGLAKRLKAKDPNADISVYAYKWREVDGITPEQARVSAAVINIANGSGTIIDAAKILRVNPEKLTALSQSTGFVRQARDLAKVTDEEAFGMVVNEIVPSNYASLVGKIVKDPAKQRAIMRLLSKSEPENMIQAEAIIRQANELEFTQTTQTGLFGDETILQSLFKERAKVLDATIKIIRRDRTVFNSLVENQKRIEAEGNTLASDTNLERVSTDGQALQILQSQANRKGPLSEALNAAAAQYQKDGKLNAAASQFVESVRRGSERGDFTGTSSGYEGRRFDPAEETDPVNAAIDLAEFDPSGAGATRQADALESSVKEEIAQGTIVADYKYYLSPTADSVDIELGKIKPIRARPEGIENARKFMAQAARGEIDKRGPITLKDNLDGTYTLLDGNSTYAIASEAGMPSLPARILTDQQFAAEVAEKNAKKLLELKPDSPKKYVVKAEDLNPDQLEDLTLFLKQRQSYGSIDDIMTRNLEFNKELNVTVEKTAAESKVEYVKGDLKKRDRVEEKINDNYAGDINLIVDVSRATVLVTRPGEANEFIKNLGKNYHVVDEGFIGPPAGSEKYSGYFDKKLMVISKDGLIGEVIVIEKNLYEAKRVLGGHKLYEIFGRENVDKPISALPPGRIKDRMVALRENLEELRAAAAEEMVKLYEATHLKMGDEFRQLTGNLLRSAPESIDRLENVSSSISSVRGSVKSGNTLISPQVLSDRQRNALPSSRKTAGAEPSTEKNLIETSADNIIPGSEKFKVEDTPQGSQTLVEGVDPITPATLAQQGMDAPLTGVRTSARPRYEVESKPMDEGLFDLGLRDQGDLLDLAIPVGQQLDEAGELVARTQTVKEILDEIDQDKAMLKRLEDCV